MESFFGGPRMSEAQKDAYARSKNTPTPSEIREHYKKLKEKENVTKIPIVPQSAKGGGVKVIP